MMQSKLALGSLLGFPDKFHARLTEILGYSAKVMEKMIVKDLFKRLNLHFDEARAFDFATCVNEARILG
ncbi:MAG TPA: hypothetical protein VE177_02875 [Candidatus Binatus sp.]|nr:hypothetical protein [Candidatus Binatus sp.]